MRTYECTSGSMGFPDDRGRILLGRIAAIALVSLITVRAHAQSAEDIAHQTQQDSILEGENCRLGLPSCSQGRAAPAPPPKPDVWGALAVSPSTLNSGASWNYKSEADAAQSALDRCRKTGVSDCKVERTVADVCVALATSKTERIFGIGGPTGAGNFADNAALLKCRRGGGTSCIVQASFCADGERHELNGHTAFSNGNPIFVPDVPSRKPTTRGAAPAGDDTVGFYGTWTAQIRTNGQAMTLLSVHDSLGYRNFVVTATGNVPMDSGTFSAANGKYRSSAARPNDSGTYRFLDSETAVCTNAAGQTVTWKRKAKPVEANVAAKAVTGYSPPTERPGTVVKK